MGCGAGHAGWGDRLRLLPGDEQDFDDFPIATDQPIADGGMQTAPSPFDLFRASLATCAGYCVAAFI